jgi:hypothetical protein
VFNLKSVLEPISTVPAKCQDIERLFREVYGESEGTDEFLQHLVERHQELVFNHSLSLCELCLPKYLRISPEGKLLAAVGYYDDQHQLPLALRDWEKASQLFLELETLGSSIVEFYVNNYLCLCQRQLKRSGGIRSWFDASMRAANKVEIDSTYFPARHHQLKGFAVFNMARCVAEMAERRVDEAPNMMRGAANHRLTYWYAVDDEVRFSELERRSAATQVWRVRHDWESICGCGTLDTCPVTAEISNDLVARGLVDESFSAAKK